MTYRLDGSKSSLGASSRRKLATVDNDLAHVVEQVSKWMNISVLSGHRGMEEQNRLVEQGFSRLKFPSSKHNVLPLSHAVDIAPYNAELKGIDWNDIEAFEEMVTLVKVVASVYGLEIACGADWKSFKDYPHVELK